MNERLRASNRELETFASIASHDLQEPLRKIQSFADILMTRYSEGIEGPAKDYINKMQQSGTRMRLLIDNMLGYSRLTSQAQQIEKVELRNVIKIVLSDLETVIESKSAKIEIEDLPSIDADKYQMHQLFQNLIGNSLKFQKPGATPLITIRQVSNGSPAPLPIASVSSKSRLPSEVAARLPSEVAAKSAPNVVLELTDNGIGFEQEYADKVFGMFQRLHGRREYEGTGIGLAVCQKIVERHHGSIRVRSRVNEGTTFEITLPKQQTNAVRI